MMMMMTTMMMNYFAGLIGDFCIEDADCYVANSDCVSNQCECRNDMIADDDNTACIGQCARALL